MLAQAGAYHQAESVFAAYTPADPGPYFGTIAAENDGTLAITCTETFAKFQQNVQVPSLDMVPAEVMEQMRKGCTAVYFTLQVESYEAPMAGMIVPFADASVGEQRTEDKIQSEPSPFAKEMPQGSRAPPALGGMPSTQHAAPPMQHGGGISLLQQAPPMQQGGGVPLPQQAPPMQQVGGMLLPQLAAPPMQQGGGMPLPQLAAPPMQQGGGMSLPQQAPPMQQVGGMPLPQLAAPPMHEVGGMPLPLVGVQPIQQEGGMPPMQLGAPPIQQGGGFLPAPQGGMIQSPQGGGMVLGTVTPAQVPATFTPWFVFGKHSFLGQQGRKCFDSYQGTVLNIASDKTYATVMSDQIWGMFGKYVRIEKPDSERVKNGDFIEFIICATDAGVILGKLVSPGGIFSGTVGEIGPYNTGRLISPEARSVLGLDPVMWREDAEAYNLKTGDLVIFYLLLHLGQPSVTDPLARAVLVRSRYFGFLRLEGNTQRLVVHNLGLRQKFGYGIAIEELPSGAMAGDELEFSLEINVLGLAVARNCQRTGKNDPAMARSDEFPDTAALAAYEQSLFVSYIGTITKLDNTIVQIDSPDLSTRTPFKDGVAHTTLAAVPVGATIGSAVRFTVFVNAAKRIQAENVVFAAVEGGATMLG